ncbi:hypothetical protein BB347_00845 [Natronorubrum daqingense]|nr:hypothetical protein BB347_00845 [Natronorubrum daqingense]
MGVLVHIIGLVFGFIGAGVVYLLSSSEYTEANAQNALNWQLFFFASFALAFLVGIGLQSVSGTITSVAVLVIFLLFVIDIAFCVWATIKASGDTAWEYPLAPKIL